MHHIRDEKRRQELLKRLRDAKQLALDAQHAFETKAPGSILAVEEEYRYYRNKPPLLGGYVAWV